MDITLKEKYNTEVKSKLMKELGITNPMAVPHIIKIVVNVGAGEAVSNKNVIGHVEEQLTLITGQKPIVTKARKSISAFKIRQGFPIGVKVTLRGQKMYEFLEKIIRIVMPRFRDFRGITHTSVDQHGNLNLGFTEQTLFPEIEFDKIDKIRGLEVTVVTNARNHEKGYKLFEELGIPFKKV
ncbi:50S ribosomal protein L5 [Candidatus Roizmanbacteria bacterium]|nr:50S ribosomal protein L5 [Candidatus Roizmanbacteria bacterium]